MSLAWTECAGMGFQRHPKAYSLFGFNMPERSQADRIQQPGVERKRRYTYTCVYISFAALLFFCQYFKKIRSRRVWSITFPDIEFILCV